MAPLPPKTQNTRLYAGRGAAGMYELFEVSG